LHPGFRRLGTHTPRFCIQEKPLTAADPHAAFLPGLLGLKTACRAIPAPAIGPPPKPSCGICLSIRRGSKIRAAATAKDGSIRNITTGNKRVLTVQH